LSECCPPLPNISERSTLLNPGAACAIELIDNHSEMMKDPFDQSDEIVPFIEEFAGASNNQASAGGTHRRKDDQSSKSGNYVSVDCSFV
jgi:hypothetical protein